MTDLGIAEREGRSGPWVDMGIAQYRAPELIQQGYSYGRAVGWWASGATLYEMLTQTLVYLTTTQLYIHSCLFEGSSNVYAFVFSHSGETMTSRNSTLS